MKSTRTERLIRMASRFLTLPSRQISLTEMSEQFEVSKTVISDDVTIIDKAFRETSVHPSWPPLPGSFHPMTGSFRGC